MQTAYWTMVYIARLDLLLLFCADTRADAEENVIREH